MSFPEKLHKLLIPRQSAKVNVDEVIGAFESDTAAVFRKTAPMHERVVINTIAVMLLLFLILASVVKLDRVVTGTGLVLPLGGSLYVSPISTAIVKQVLVKQGDIVEKGQPLATLDATFTQADLMQLQQQNESSQAELARLQAEQDGNLYKGGASSFEVLQANIFTQRQAEYRSTLNDFDGRIRSVQAQVEEAKKNALEYEKRLRLATDVEKIYRPLAEKGYVSRLQWMSAADSKVEAARMEATALNQIQVSSQTLASLVAQKESYVQKWHSDISNNMVRVKNELDVTRQGLEKSKKLQDLTTLVAPDKAVVLKIGKISTGSITGFTGAGDGSDSLFTLQPLDSPVQAEIKVNSRDIGFIKQGDTVRLKLDAYQFMRHGTVAGVVKTISEGSFERDDEGTSEKERFFKVRVDLTDLKLRNVPEDFRLIPGMTLAGDILVGKRTILSYLVEGALRTGSEAMREPL